ncbi:uncharacterized protein LOC110872907 [Helianthus annuus]|uniref:uncharacterized protein LOC110872907 n=1 Tax=Helianthus annuus TaxID=4232 RepID=UPI000B8FEA74|nr:uncharacterized protein LOC110872907 [Helianthus annuus]
MLTFGDDIDLSYNKFAYNSPPNCHVVLHILIQLEVDGDSATLVALWMTITVIVILWTILLKVTNLASCKGPGGRFSNGFIIAFDKRFSQAFWKSYGHGGLGDVVLCKNKLDGRQYDVKKIQLKGGSHPLDDKIKYLVGIANNLAFLVLYPSGGRAY